MDNNGQILSTAILGFELEFYSKYSKNQIAKSLGEALNKRIQVYRKYHSSFKPTREIFKIEPDFSGGSLMNELVTGPLPYYEAIPILIRTLKWISENAWTDKRCALQFNISFNSNDPTFPNIQALNKLKFVLGYDEEFVFRLFPDRRDSLYCKTIKTIKPSNKFMKTGNLHFIDPNSYKVPMEKNLGVNFTKLDDHYLEIRYVGGNYYEQKYSDIKKIIDYTLLYTYQTLQNNEHFSKDDFIKLQDYLDVIYKSSQTFVDVESFYKNYPELRIFVDLKEDPQILKTFFHDIRDRLYDIIVQNSITKGLINYDSRYAKYQLKDIETQKASLLKDYDLIDCKIMGNVLNCRAQNCEFDNSHLEYCEFLNGNDIYRSKVIDSDIPYSNKLIDCYIDIKDGEINCEVENGIIRSGYIGKMAELSYGTELVDDNFDIKHSKKGSLRYGHDFKDKNGKKGSIKGGSGFKDKNDLRKATLGNSFTDYNREDKNKI